jgi:hypothetical protein
MAMFMHGVVRAHHKEYSKARAALLNAQRREERKTGAPLPLTHLHLSQTFEQLKELPTALTHAQRELDLLRAHAASSIVAVPPSVLEKVEARMSKLTSQCAPPPAAAQE